MTPAEIKKLEAYLRDKFSCETLHVKFRQQVKDSAEVLLDREFIGVIYRDEDEGEISYQFQMCVIEEDLA